MKSNDIRTSFIEYFANNEHIIKESSSLIPNDPTLLLTAAGMVQFKDYFLGNAETDDNKLVTVQKCVRTPDIDIIGDTSRHLTFFEMLGNFSIGQYFKKDAIKYAYEYVTNVLKIPESDIWITVYKDDEEAKNIWIDDIGVPAKRIQKGDKDNFWHMNIPGPCGPCSEIFIDRGPKYGKGGGPINGGEDRYIEIWNLVFMQYIQDKPYNVVGDLPAKNVDTGMGLERVAMILQNKKTIFETDLFKPIIDSIEIIHSIKYGENDKSDKHIRIISDHIRSTTFLLSDGVVPTNEGRGYILRRLIRRAIRSSSLLNNENNDISKLLEVIIENYNNAYQSLSFSRESILEMFNNEQDLFYKTLQKGELEVKSIIDKTETLTAEDSYILYDRYGFPFELTQEIALEHNIILDKKEYDLIVEDNKKHNKDTKNSKFETTNKYPKTEFIGYEKLDTESIVTGVEKIDNDKSIVFTDLTPLYFEAGGQVSDKGEITHDDKTYKIHNTIEMPNGSIGNILDLTDITVGDKIVLNTDKKFRYGSSKSHTAAHIVHASLRNILGDNVSQAGSNVEPGRLRFDFSHSKKVNDEELDEIFTLSNQVIFENYLISTNIMNIDDAKKTGALAFFGDKYGDDVRVVDIGDHSKELCGGTHVSSSSEIGLVVLTNESSIGSNLRRVEMLSGFLAFEFLSNAKTSLNKVSDILKVQEDKVLTKISNQLDQLEEYKLHLKKSRKDFISNEAIRLEQEIFKIKNKSVLVNIVDYRSNDEARELINILINNLSLNICIIMNNIDGKNSIVGATDKKTELDISVYIQQISEKLGGGASKDPNFSIGGGPKKYDLNEAVKILTDTLNDDLS